MNTLECIKTRHSTRKFKPEPVAQELLDTVIDAGRRAPTGGNLQPTHFMVITNPDVLKELVTLVQEEYGKTEVTEQTPPYMVNIIKMSKEGKFVFHYNAPVLIVLAHKPVLANNFSDTAWVNQLRHLQDNERIIKRLRELGMGDDEKVYASLAIGYPDLPNGLNRRELDIKGNPVTYID